jgi:hypothetical protein
MQQDLRLGKHALEEPNDQVNASCTGEALKEKPKWEGRSGKMVGSRDVAMEGGGCRGRRRELKSHAEKARDGEGGFHG